MASAPQPTKSLCHTSLVYTLSQPHSVTSHPALKLLPYFRWASSLQGLAPTCSNPQGLGFYSACLLPVCFLNPCLQTSASERDSLPRMHTAPLVCIIYRAVVDSGFVLPGPCRSGVWTSSLSSGDRSQQILHSRSVLPDCHGYQGAQGPPCCVALNTSREPLSQASPENDWDMVIHQHAPDFSSDFTMMRTVG